MRKFTPLFAELQIMELFEFRSCLNLNGFLQSVDSCTTMSWLAREFHRRVRPAIARRFLWADTSPYTYGKYNVIRTFVGAHRCVRPAIARRFLWADTSVNTSTTYKKACPCKKSRPRNIKVLNYFLFSNENLLAIDNVDTGNGNRVNLTAGEVINSTLAEVIAGNTLNILNTGCTAPVEAIELNSFVGY